MRAGHLDLLADLLQRSEAEHLARPEEFRRYGSARKLYSFHVDNAGDYQDGPGFADGAGARRAGVFLQLRKMQGQVLR